MRTAGKSAAALLALLVSALALLVEATPASAHAGLLLTVNDDGRGSVSVDVSWSDGHPVTESIAGALVAVAASGQQVGPVALTRLPGQPTIVYDQPLAAGQWQVTVDVALPGIGHCAAAVRVAAGGGTPTPGSTRCGEPATPVAAAPAPPSGSGWPIWATVAIGAAVILAAGVALRRLRRPAPPAGKPARKTLPAKNAPPTKSIPTAKKAVRNAEAGPHDARARR
jgi:hypothetical protein